MQFDLWTFGLQLVNFLILLWLLQRFLYRPVQNIIEQRRALVEGKQAEAERLRQTAEEERDKLERLQKEFESGREKRLADLNRELEAKRVQARTERLLEMKEMKRKAQSEIAAERRQALLDIQGEVAHLATAMATKVLSERTPQTHLLFEPVENALERLSDAEKERILRDLSKDSAKIRVVTPAPLPADAEEHWRKRLDDFVGRAGPISFETDPTLIDGVEVRFPHAVLNVNFADALGKLKESIQENDIAH